MMMSNTKESPQKTDETSPNTKSSSLSDKHPMLRRALESGSIACPGRIQNIPITGSAAARNDSVSDSIQSVNEESNLNVRRNILEGDMVPSLPLEQPSFEGNPLPLETGLRSSKTMISLGVQTNIDTSAETIVDTSAETNVSSIPLQSEKNGDSEQKNGKLILPVESSLRETNLPEKTLQSDVQETGGPTSRDVKLIEIQPAVHEDKTGFGSQCIEGREAFKREISQTSAMSETIHTSKTSLDPDVSGETVTSLTSQSVSLRAKESPMKKPRMDIPEKIRKETSERKPQQEAAFTTLQSDASFFESYMNEKFNLLFKEFDQEFKECTEFENVCVEGADALQQININSFKCILNEIIFIYEEFVRAKVFLVMQFSDTIKAAKEKLNQYCLSVNQPELYSVQTIKIAVSSRNALEPRSDFNVFLQSKWGECWIFVDLFAKNYLNLRRNVSPADNSPVQENLIFSNKFQELLYIHSSELDAIRDQMKEIEDYNSLCNLNNLLRTMTSKYAYIMNDLVKLKFS